MEKIKQIINRALGSFTGLRLIKNKQRERLPLTRKHARPLIYFTKIFELIKDVPGDVVECGVWRGRSLLLLSFLAEGRRKIWAFDSFRGFPKGKYISNFRDTSKNIVVETLKNGHSQADVEIVEGFFADTLKNFKAKIALLHIDADLYDSHMTCFKYLFPQISDGGIVMFDEYDDPNWPDAKKAIDDFFRDKPFKLQQDDLSGKFFVIKTSDEFIKK